jgi:hypothetical protein
MRAELPNGLGLVDLGTSLAVLRCMRHLTHATLNEFTQILREFDALQQRLEAGQIDFTVLVSSERELWSKTQCALAGLANDAGQAIAFERLLSFAEEIKAGGRRAQDLAGRCQRILQVLCGGALELEERASCTLAAAIELGRIVRALKLVDRAVTSKGPVWAGRMLERVRHNVLGASVRVGQPNPTYDRTVQLAS